MFIFETYAHWQKDNPEAGRKMELCRKLTTEVHGSGNAAASEGGGWGLGITLGLSLSAPAKILFKT